MNSIYIVSVILYVIEGYMIDDGEHRAYFLIFMNCGLLYPVVYEIIQCIKTGPLDYISGNKIDVFYYLVGIANGIL